MNRKLIGVLIILAGAIVIIGIVYVVFFYDFSKGRDIVEEQGAPEQIEVREEDERPVILPASPVEEREMKISSTEITKMNLKRMAASFAERFGSYSNHSNYGNIVDLKIFMSREMQVWADNFIDEIRANSDYSDIYYGITTKAISEEIQEFDEDIGQAEILVKTQRRESTGTMSNAVTFYQDILIVFIKERGSWKVNSAHWQN